ncbi:uncharacterized protein LOC143280678 [Babylonia areolata]|uniref:uncharacterized protein LOC143280678 n=1 Tax=Babylonia areolata TaxID=304850 RepID=UPI003FD4A2DF
MCTVLFLPQPHPPSPSPPPCRGVLEEAAGPTIGTTLGKGTGHQALPAGTPTTTTMLPAAGNDVSYVLLEPPVVPPLDLSPCRPTELPALPEATPTPQPRPLHNGPAHTTATPTPQPRPYHHHHGSAPPRSDGHHPAGKVEAARDCDSDVTHGYCLPPAQAPSPQPKVTEVRTLVVDMRDLDKYGADSTNRTLDSCSPDRDGQDLNQFRGAKRVGGVLKGGGQYVSCGVQKPRPRVSFLLDAFPGDGQEGNAMQIRVYAKPQQDHENQTGQADHQNLLSPGRYPHPHAVVNHHPHAVNHSRVSPAPTNGLPPKGIRPLGSTERRKSASSYRQQLRNLQAERHAPRSADSANRTGRRVLHDIPHPLTCTPHLPNVGHAHHRVSLFPFKRKTSNADAAYIRSPSREGRGRRSFTLPPNAGSKPVRAHVRFQEPPNDDSSLLDLKVDSGQGRLGMEDSAAHVEPGSREQGGRSLGTYSASDHPPRAASCSRPPMPPRPAPIHTASVLDLGDGPGGYGQHQVNSPGSWSGRVREWLSVDSVPNSSLGNRPRPSTVSSVSSSSRSRDLNTANQKLAGSSSSRASSASLKAASDPGPGPDLDEMDMVTLNLMARRAKGSSRYRYLAKLRSMNLNMPSTMDC